VFWKDFPPVGAIMQHGAVILHFKESLKLVLLPPFVNYLFLSYLRTVHQILEAIQSQRNSPDNTVYNNWLIYLGIYDP
jgi:hypothetical protein